MRLPPKKPPKIGLFGTFASQKKVKKEERGSNTQNLPRTPHNSFPFPLRGYIYIYIYIYIREEREGRSSFRIYAVNPLFSRERVVLGKESVVNIVDFFSLIILLFVFVFETSERGHGEGCRRWFFLLASAPR